MMAKFNIKSSFVFSSRKSFVLVGDIVEGKVGDGMILLTGDDNLGDLIIDSVVSLRGDFDSFGLLIKYNHQEELERLKDLENRIMLIKAL
jgi:hypothetical protein